MDQVVVVRELGTDIAQASGDHVEHAAGRIQRHFLLKPGDPATAFDADFAIVRLQLAGQQFHQGRLAGAVAADQGDALARFDGQVDMFQQQRATDAVVEALQSDQRHPPIVRAGAVAHPRA